MQEFAAWLEQGGEPAERWKPDGRGQVKYRSWQRTLHLWRDRNAPRPWGSHETKLLRKLAQAAEKFWERYDPDDPGTAPTNEQVSAWLQSQDVTPRVAEVMAQILRADGLPSG